MSDLVAAVAEKLGGAPEDLVLRSAQARAAAQGLSVDEVLAAWAGGASVASAPAPAPAEAPAAAETPATEEPPAPSPAEPPAEAPAPAAAVAAPAPAAVTVLEEEEIEPVEPAPLRDRIRFGLRVGAVAGALLGVIGMVLSSPLVLNRAAVVGEGNDAAVAVTAGATVITIGVVSAVFGAIIAIFARAVPRFTGPEYAVRGTARSAAVTGAITGLVLGAIGGGVLVATGVEALDGGTLLPVRSGLLAVLIGGAVLGAITGAVSQLVTVPATVVDEDVEEVRDRISNAVMVPAVAAIGIVGFVVPLGTLLVEFHEFAPLIGIVVSGLILAFAFLMSTSPRISRAEFLVAAAGVGVTLLLIAAVASQMGGDEGGEEHAAVPIVLRVV